MAWHYTSVPTLMTLRYIGAYSCGAALHLCLLLVVWRYKGAHISGLALHLYLP
jgi:hypothetical protein